MYFDLEFDCGSRDLEMTLLEKISSTCLLHNIKKLEVYYFSLACNIKSKYASIIKMGHSTSNEQIFRNPHALRPLILFNFFSVLPNYPNPKFKLPTPNSF